MPMKCFKRLFCRWYEKDRIRCCDFSVDYYAIAVDDILDIHRCLRKKNGIV